MDVPESVPLPAFRYIHGGREGERLLRVLCSASAKPRTSGNVCATRGGQAADGRAQPWLWAHDWRGQQLFSAALAQGGHSSGTTVARWGAGFRWRGIQWTRLGAA